MKPIDFSLLNPPQQEAVRHKDGPMLILAGAGSGKTATLINRIAYLVEKHRVSPYEILAVTFTNKAALEMKERAEKLLGKKGSMVSISTFHSFCARILRKEIFRIPPYTAKYTVLDDSDSLSLIKEVMAELGLDEERHEPRFYASTISSLKNELITPALFSKISSWLANPLTQISLPESVDLNKASVTVNKISMFNRNALVSVYARYQAKLSKSNAADFEDLIMLTIRVFEEFPEVLSAYQERYKYIMIDEYQDTNHSQCILSTMLAAKHQNITVVGDDYQCLHPDTLVSTPEGKVRIKDVSVGGTVFAAKGGGKEKPALVEAVLSKDYSGQMLFVETERGGSLLGTPEHCVFARYSTEEYRHCLFLVRNPGSGYRLKRISFFAGEDAFKAMRAHLSEGEEAWLLESSPFEHEIITLEPYFNWRFNVNDYTDKAAFEQKLSVEGGIFLDQPFFSVASSQGVFSLFGKPGKIATLSLDGKNVAQGAYDSTWEKIKKIPHSASLSMTAKITSKDSFFTPLSHLKEGMKVCLEIDGEIVEDEVAEITLKAHTGKVFDLNVSGYRNYVAGGIVVHNSIYSFRGADIRNILNFEKIYAPNTKTIKLTQNYRSTSQILELANKVIAVNPDQKKKTLWTDMGVGIAPAYSICGDADEEGLFVAEQIAALCKKGSPFNFATKDFNFKDIAILYRVNAQSRPLEDALLAKKIPYRIHGGMSFYARQEIKNVMAYLRLTLNPSDRTAFKRAVNVPARGIGKKTVEKLLLYAEENDLTTWEVLLVAEKIFTGAVLRKLQSFAALIEKLQEEASQTRVGEFMEIVLEDTGYRKSLQVEDGVQDEDSNKARLENLAEFLNIAWEYQDSEEASLESFVERILLNQEESKKEENMDCVTLMTIHSAKGLEYPVVFLVGVEEGLLPYVKSFETTRGVEEERRLCYVAVTRAKKRLFISRAVHRFLYNKVQKNNPSRFLIEMGLEERRKFSYASQD